MKKILIYQDYVDDNNNAHNLRAFQEARPHDTAQFCDAHDILDGILNDKVDLFVMPGGRATYYCEKLNGTGNTCIKDYVEQGGTYLGLCGGAYYACTETIWAKGQKDEIYASGELCFFEGSAIGPICEFIESDCTEKSWDQAVTLNLDDTTQTTTLYRAGPYFTEPKNETTKVIARYSDAENTPPAILNCKVGKGHAVLCGVHPERSPALYEKMIYKHRNPSYQWQLDVLKKYKKGWRAETDLFMKVLNIALDK